MLSFFFSDFSVLLLCLLRRSHLFSFSCVTVKLRGDLERDVFYINASFFFLYDVTCVFPKAVHVDKKKKRKEE